MFVVRPFRESDRPFIVDSFCQSYYGAPAVRGMPKDDYFPWFKRRVNHYCDLMDAYVAVSETDDDAILGWALMEPTAAGYCLHYVFVRGGAASARGCGIAKALVAAAGYDVAFYSHRSNGVTSVPRGWTYRPDLADFGPYR